MKNNIKLSIAAIFAVSSLYALEDLGTITVSSATKSQQSIQDVTSNVEVITSYELEEKHITTVSEALNLISGISFTSNGGLGKTTSLNIRGMDTKGTLVLIDGIRYNDVTSASGASFADIMITDIEKIEVIKGAQSGIWGSDASAGVVNIITKKQKKGLTTNLNTEYGSFNTKKYGAMIGYSTNKYYLSINSQKITTDGFTSHAQYGIDIDSYEDDGYENITTNVKAGFNLNENNKIDLIYTKIDSELEYDSASADTDNTSKTNNILSGVKFQNKINDITTEIFANNSDFHREYDSGSEFDGELKEYGIKSNLSYLQDSFLILGFDQKKAIHENTLNKEYTNKGYYLTNNNSFNKNLIVTESLRVDQYDAFQNKTTGKFGIKYNLNKDLSLSSNYGTAYNVPTIYQLYAPLCCGLFKVGNENLKPENIKSYDISIAYKDIKFTYFKNIVSDLIDYDFSQGFINLDGESTFKGIEVDYKKSISSIVLSLNYTNLSAKDSNGYKLEKKAEDILKFGIDYYGIDKLHLGINGEYVGDRIEYKRNTHDIEAQTGKYTVANAVINYDMTKSFKIYGKIDNITDKYYQTVDGYATSPRAFYAGVKVKF